MLFSEVVEAEAAGAVPEGCWEEELLEARLVAAEEVPLEAEVVGAEGVRVEVEGVLEACCCGTDLSLLDLRVEPTSLRKREFMDDIQRGAFLAEGRKQKKKRREGEGGVGFSRREEVLAWVQAAGEIGHGAGGSQRSVRHGQADVQQQWEQQQRRRQRASESEACCVVSEASGRCHRTSSRGGGGGVVIPCCAGSSSGSSMEEADAQQAAAVASEGQGAKGGVAGEVRG